MSDLWPLDLTDLSPVRLALAAALLLFGVVFGLWLRRRLKQGDEGGLPTEVAARWLPFGVMASAALGAAELAELAPVAEGLRAVEHVLSYPLPEVAGQPLTALSILVFLFVLAFGWRVSHWVQAAVGKALKLRRDVDDGVIAALQRLTHYAVIGLSVVFALQLAGFDLTALMAASTIVAVGLGFGLQTLVTNFVAGMMLLLERSIKPGDIISVDGELVKITTLGIRATIGVTPEDDEVIIPNSRLIDNPVVNHSFQSDVVRARALVGVSYDSDLDVVQTTLERVAEQSKDRVRHKPAVVLLKDFGDSSVVFDVSIWVGDAFGRPKALSNLRHAIWKALHEQKVVIAYPQLDVHFDADITRAITTRNDSGRS